MGPESFSQKPESVRDAIRSGDKEVLSRAGKKGAKVAVQNREIRKDEEKEANKQYTIEHTYRDILHEDGEEAAEAFLNELEQS